MRKTWSIYLPSFALKHWKEWTGKKRMLGWCCGDCLSHPIDFNLDETCSRCGATFGPNIHFIRCNGEPCPMKSTEDTRSLMDILFSETKEAK